MLPKVATHILHSTSRAAATIHQQTHTIRNVLQLQSSSGPSGSGSGRSGNGPGTGSAKHNAGSRFYSGYNGAGRAVTQANALTSHNDGSFQSDDNDNELAVVVSPRRKALHPKHKRTRIRSASLSLSPADRRERGEKLGVLKTVQLHTRSKHVFAPEQQQGAIEAKAAAGNELRDTAELDEPTARPVLVRRNSTSSSDGLDSPIGGVRRNSTASVHSDAAGAAFPDALPPPSPVAKTQPSTDPSAPQSPVPPSPRARTPTPQPQPAPSTAALSRARDTHDPSTIAEAVHHFRRTHPSPTTNEYNLALEALIESRPPGEPLTLVLETYNEMLARSVNPNFRTYLVLVQALTNRDFELFKLDTALSARVKRTELPGGALSPVPKEEGAPDSEFPPLAPRTTSPAADAARITALRAESNFPSAMALFETLLSLGQGPRLPLSVYTSLLRSCAIHGSVDGAIHVFAQLERRADLKPPPHAYRSLMQAYTNAGQASAAEAVFGEYRAAVASGRIDWTADDRARTVEKQRAWGQKAHLQVYNQMVESWFRAGRPEEGVGLVETMLGVAGEEEVPQRIRNSQKGGEAEWVMDPPAPGSSTFSTVLAGFVSLGDIDTALSWFDRLLQQSTPSADPWASIREPVRPDAVAWAVMFDALALTGRVQDLNRLFEVLMKEGPTDQVELRPADCALVFGANVRFLEGRLQAVESAEYPTAEEKNKAVEEEREEATKILQWLEDNVLHPAGLFGSWRQTAIKHLARAYVVRGMYAPATTSLSRVLDSDRAAADSSVPRSPNNKQRSSPVNVWMGQQRIVQAIVQEVYDRVRVAAPGVLDYEAARALARLSEVYAVRPEGDRAPYFLHTYGVAREAGVPAGMEPGDWDALVDAGLYMEMRSAQGGPTEAWMAPVSATGVLQANAFPGVPALLGDMFLAGGPEVFGEVRPELMGRAVKILLKRHGVEEVTHLGERLGKVFVSFVEKEKEAHTAALAKAMQAAQEEGEKAVGMELEEEGVEDPAEAYRDVKLDLGITRYVEAGLSQSTDPKQNVLVAFARFEKGLKQGKAPAPIVLSRLIEQLGRVKRMGDVRQVYTVAQALLNRPEMEADKEAQGDLWFRVEDSMIIALAHAGDIDSAHVHRARIIEQGRAPTADAYGALILYVKDTTDDTSNALALYQEAQMYNVQPNLYFYNNIISKLAKARKADYALELFQQMRAQGVAPSSITYGAVIGACARVGDVASAEYLFEEMTRARNFKPRVPPYNTMMQLYTTTKPNRERAVHYYNELLKARVAPSAHTYKLLLDAYGSNEPVDIESMELVFQELQKNRQIPIQGPHIASLINAYGCVQKDLDKAIAVFDAVPTYRGHPARDAVVFEAMFNVLVALRRTDLIPEYVTRMSECGVHMTAYIANFLIKGYAIVGDMTQARSIFESLLDPQIGMAAPNNHAPHDPSTSPVVNPMEPVYREPSTWEAMVRAELGAGHRDRAVALLERLKARQYPEAVYNRISGVLVDHSMVLS